ncbi:hypothetical protein N311_11132, partial [Apaloderma vittatum]
TPDSIIGTEMAEEVGVVTTDVAVAAVVSTTVEVDVVTTGQEVTVGVVTTVLGKGMVATGATIPVAAMTFTVAAGVVDEGVVQVPVLGSDIAGAAMTVITGEEQAGSLGLVWPGALTGGGATPVLSTVTGEAMVAVVTPGE